MSPAVKQYINKIIKRVLPFILVLAFVQFICVVAAAFGLLNRLPHSIALPLGPIGGIVVDNQNRLYVANSFLGHVQIYDTNGAFVRGWFAKTRGGAFRIRMSAAGNLEVAAAGRKTIDSYDEFGKLVSSRPDTAAFSRWSHLSSAASPDGTSWEVVDPFFIPRITGYKDRLTKIVSVRNRFYPWLLIGLFPLFLFTLLAMLLSSLEKLTATTGKRKTAR